MHTIIKLFLSGIVLVIAFSLWKSLKLVWYHPFYSSLRHLRGPKGTHFMLGNLGDMVKDESGILIEKWLNEYGNTLRFRGFLNNYELLTTDTRAINHIIHSNVYEKPPDARYSLAQLFGEGLLVVEGSQHRQQRRVMNPAFGPTQIRALTDTFFAKALQLRNLWSSEISRDVTAAITGTRIDVVPWLAKVTLDIIGLTGFNYDFHALDSSGEPNELSEAFSTIFKTSQTLNVFEILRVMIPVLRFIHTTESRSVQVAQRTMTRIGKELLANAKAAALSNEFERGGKEGTNLQGRDLLSLLVKANMANDTSESQRLSDKDVIAQVPTFFVAGHETTSSAVTWALYALTQAPHVQTKLREELLSVDTDTPSMDELMALPYLDAVVREILRLHSPVPATSRFATKDDVIPVENPYTDRNGIVRNTIKITKGDPIIIPILALNRSKELWGPDAHEFKPERWIDVPEGVSRIPGIWGHLLTFLGGPRACIGFRFSLVEFKTILFTLVRAFEFELAVPVSEVSSKTAIVQRPVLRNDPTNQAQLPLLVRPCQRA